MFQVINLYASFRTFHLFIETTTKLSHLCSDIWQQILQYFSAIELFFTFTNITTAADQVLFNRKYHLRLQGLVLDSYVQNLPKQLSFDRVISVTMHNKNCFDLVEQCLELRSLKLIGESEWIISLLRKCPHMNTKLEQLTVIMPDISPLYELMACVLPSNSLRRLEICADQVEERIRVSALSMVPSKIEQFVLNSCSSIEWDDLAYMQPGLINVRMLNISLFHRSKKSFRPLFFPCLRSLYISLLEVPFDWIIQLVTVMPCLGKLKLTGLVDGESFAINHKWFHLLKSVPSLVRITVNVSLEQDRQSFHCEKLQMALRAINLSLTCIDDNCDYYSSQRSEQRWWHLEGVIIKEHCGRL
jgi:hypothetical protein